MNFGKSRAKTADELGNNVTFEDVAGADEEKQELREIVDFLRNPKAFTEMGARIPKGVLLVALRAQAKHCLQKRLPVKPKSPSSPSAVPNSSSFTSASVQAVCAIFSTPQSAAPPLLFSLTKSMLSAGREARDSAAAMMNVSRP